MSNENLSLELIMFRREALRRWRSSQGLRANFGSLLELFVKAGHSMCAEAVCDLLKKKYTVSTEFCCTLQNLYCGYSASSL